MRFLMILCLATFVLANDFLEAPKAYEKNDSPKIEVGGEILLRYEKHKTTSEHLKRPSRGSEGTLSISTE